MRCKKHFTDLSSIVGVCASCLRERLFTLIEAQAQEQWQAHIKEDHRKSDANPPELIFPRSVSPYISRRKSDNNPAAWPQLQHSLSDQRFYSTPQIGPNGVIITSSLYKKKQGKFSLLSGLFRSKTQKFDLDSKESFSTATTTATAMASPSWLSNFFPAKRKEKSRNFTMTDPTVDRGNQRSRRGLSPTTVESDDECCDGSSGYASDSSQGWKETPRRAAAASVHRSGGRQNQPRNQSSLAFCLSPLVRASPNRHWSQKVMPPEATLPGETRAPAKPHLGVAAAFRANRSRKLANFGRFHPNY